ncbi:MAG: hypothetical protein QM730_12530 [Anaerolineales bacterium]
MTIDEATHALKVCHPNDTIRATGDAFGRGVRVRFRNSLEGCTIEENNATDVGDGEFSIRADRACVKIRIW